MLQLQTHLTPKEAQAAYSSWFDDRIDQYALDHKPAGQSVSDFKRAHGLFVTISFDQRAKDRIGQSELEIFSDLYNRIGRRLVGRNYHRPSFRDRLPLAIACLDANGSRYWKSMGAIDNAHIHSIWLFGEATGRKLQNLIADSNWFPAIKERFGIRAVDIQPLDHERRNLTGGSRISSYASKFLAHNNRDLVAADDLRIFPI